jgi:hypothetical protein
MAFHGALPHLFGLLDEAFGGNRSRFSGHFRIFCCDLYYALFDGGIVRKLGGIEGGVSCQSGIASNLLSADLSQASLPRSTGS